MTEAFPTLQEAASWSRRWLSEAALPLWASRGVDPVNCAFQEALTVEGAPVQAPRRARVQARQTFVYATAAGAGFGDRWLEVAIAGFEAFERQFGQPDGRFAALVSIGGEVLDSRPRLYDQDFALLAMAALHGAGWAEPRMTASAARLRHALAAFRHAAGGFREAGDRPFQANAHMHLLESALAWEEAGLDDWSELSDEIVELALERFIDPAGNFLREFFDQSWRPAAGDDGRLVEPGHQFEWAWLMARWGRRRADGRGAAAARRLFAAGLKGVDPSRSVAVNALVDDFTVRDASARLWPQTEFLKAALILGEEAHALTAVRGLAKYLATPAPGAWRDRMLPDGGFVEEPAPASSFYHIVGAMLELQAGRTG